MSLESVRSMIDSIRSNLDELSGIKDLYDAERKLQEIDKKIKNVREEIEIMNEDGSSFTQPLLKSLKTEEKDLDILEIQYNKSVEQWKRLKRIEDLKEGKLTGADTQQAKREMQLDNLKEVDNQGLMIDSIHNNIKNANNNLVNINTELDNQGQKIDRIENHVLEAENQVKKTGKVMTKLENRAKCIQFLAFFAVIILGLFDVALITTLTIRKFR